MKACTRVCMARGTRREVSFYVCQWGGLTRIITLTSVLVVTSPLRYVVRACQSGSVIDVVVKAIDLAHPVANLGGESLPFMSASWKRSGTVSAQLDGDAVASLWRSSNLASPPPGEGCPETTNITTGNGTAVLVVGCGLVTRSLEARTLNVFRFPFAVTVANVTVERDAAISIGLVSRSFRARAHPMDYVTYPLTLLSLTANSLLNAAPSRSALPRLSTLPL